GFASILGPLDTRGTADVKVQPVAHDETYSTSRLYVAPVPVPIALRNRNERFSRRPVPVEPIAAEARKELIRLRPVFRLSSPDREQAEHHAFICDRIQCI